MEPKKIIFMTPPAPKYSPFSTTEKRPPMGIGSMIASLKGHQVGFIDNYLQPHAFLDNPDVARAMFMDEQSPDFVGLYTNTICLRGVRHIINILNWLRTEGVWKGRVICGGPHASVRGLDLLTEVRTEDFVVAGEGENSILEILNGEHEGSPYVMGRTVHNMDSLPMQPWELFTKMSYDFGMPWTNVRPVYTMNTSRGCPYSCSFCSVESVWGRKYRSMSAERVFSEIELLYKKYGAQGIYFREDNFFVDIPRVHELCDLLIRNNINIKWAAEGRVDNLLTPGLLEHCSKAGMVAAYVGIESGVQERLDALNKGIKVEDVWKMRGLLKEHNIALAASFMVGFPNETQEERQATTHFASILQPATCWWNVFVGIPTSKLYRDMQRNKLYQHEDDRGLLYGPEHNELVKQFYPFANTATIRDSVKPRVSVCIPAYNAEKSLGSAIESIFNQSEQNIEILVVNDASTDGTGAVAEEYGEIAQKRGIPFHLIHLEQNVGNAAARNFAIEKASGTYIAQQDADDYSLAMRLEREADFLDKNPDHVMCGTQYYIRVDSTIALCGVQTEDAMIRRSLFIGNQFGHGTVMVRGDILKMNMYNASYRAAGDYELWSRLMDKGKLTNLVHPPEYVWYNNPKGIGALLKDEQDASAVRVKESLSAPVKIDSLTRPTFSVIIPTYRRPHLLNRAVKSVLNQKFQDFEIIIVEDDPDGITQAQLEHSSFSGDRRIKFYQHSANKGLAASRNTGIRESTGRYLSFLDDDDFFYRRHLNTHFDILNQDKYLVTYSDAYYVMEEWDGDICKTIGYSLPYSENFDRFNLLVHNLFPVNAVIVDRRMFDRVGLFDETMFTHEDWDMWIRMANITDFHHIKLITCGVSDRQDTMTNTKREDFYKTMINVHNTYKEYWQKLPHLKQLIDERHKNENPCKPSK